MADCVENQIKHLELAIRQFKQLVNVTFEGHVDVHKIEGLVIDICDQILHGYTKSISNGVMHIIYVYA